MFLIAHASTTKEKNGTTLNDNNLFSTKTGFYTINSWICKLAVFLLQYLYELANLGMKTCWKSSWCYLFEGPSFLTKKYIILDIRKRTNSDITKDILYGGWQLWQRLFGQSYE